MLPPYTHLTPYYGDIHNHCAVGYGHGSLGDALYNAQLQLDFAAITVHAHWADMPDADERLAEAVAYHQQGFARAAAAWRQVQAATDGAYRPGQFVTFLAHEWHSLAYGDHNIYYKEPPGEILREADLPALRRRLKEYRAQGRDVMVLPHHIGYRQGYRGINWAAFDAQFSPVVEIYSMHGASESADAPYPYLHTMGPRDRQSTYHYGLAQGHVVGAVGSTDHHSAHPGSYGHGRMAVWAPELTRDAVWQAIQQRRVYALTGDRIRLAFALNEGVMGQVLPHTGERCLQLEVEGGGAIDYVELLHNNRVVHHHAVRPGLDGNVYDAPLKVAVAVGWGEKEVNVDWDVALRIENGTLEGVEPRFRGHEIVAPQGSEEASYAFSSWRQEGDAVSFQTRTWGNPTTTTAATQGVCLTVRGGADTVIHGTFNGKERAATLQELLEGPCSGYLGGFLTPAFVFERAIPRAEYAVQLAVEQRSTATAREWYTVRVRQHNGQWAWSSPIWVEGANTV